MEKINTIKMLNLMIGLEKKWGNDDGDGWKLKDSLLLVDLYLRHLESTKLKNQSIVDGDVIRER